MSSIQKRLSKGDLNLFQAIASIYYIPENDRCDSVKTSSNSQMIDQCKKTRKPNINKNTYIYKLLMSY